MVNRNQTCEELQEVKKHEVAESAVLKEQTEGLWLEHSGPGREWYDAKLERTVRVRKCKVL